MDRKLGMRKNNGWKIGSVFGEQKLSQQSAMDTSMNSEHISIYRPVGFPYDNSAQKHGVGYWVMIQFVDNNCLNNQQLKDL